MFSGSFLVLAHSEFKYQFASSGTLYLCPRMDHPEKSEKLKESICIPCEINFMQADSECLQSCVAQVSFFYAAIFQNDIKKIWTLGSQVSDRFGCVIPQLPDE